MIAPGTLIHGRYRVLGQVGQGGMGAVYEAVDTRLECVVALKEALVSGDAADRAFVHEARLLAGLRHAALPVVTDYFIEGGGQFLVMQFIPGEDLGATLRRRGAPFPVEEVLRWAKLLLDVLGYLHGHQPPVIHRDIKPGNLKLTERGELVLLDFGLAKGSPSYAPDETPGPSVFGYSPRYSPPEQIEGKPTDARSDLYALGATLYHLLAGLAPPSALERSGAIISRQADPLRELCGVNPQVPPLLGRVVTRAMALHPADRYASVAEMRAALSATARADSDPTAVVESERSADEAHRTPAGPRTQARRVDAAAPTRADVGKPIDLLVQVRFADSPRLGIEDWPVAHRPERIEQASDTIRVAFPVDPRTGALGAARVVVKVVAPDFVVEGRPEMLVEVPPDDYSRRLAFLLTATRAGVCRVNVEVYGQDALYLGAIPVETDVGGEAGEAPAYRVANLVLQVLAGKISPAILSPMIVEGAGGGVRAQAGAAPPPHVPVSEATLLADAGGTAAAVPPPAAWSPPARIDLGAPGAEPAWHADAPDSAAPAARSVFRLARLAAPAVVLLFVAAAGLVFLTNLPGSVPPAADAPQAMASPPASVPPVGAAPQTGESPQATAARPLASAPQAGALPQAQAAAPRAVDASRRATAAPGRTVQLGADVPSANIDGVALRVTSVQVRGDATRLDLSVANHSASVVTIAFDYDRSVVSDGRGGRLRILRDSAGTAVAAVFAADLRPGRALQHWIEVPALSPHASTVEVTLARPSTVSRAPVFGTFSVRMQQGR